MKKLLVIAFCLLAFVVYMRFKYPPSPQSAVLAAPVQAVAPVMAIRSATPSPVWISAATNDPRLNAEMTLLFIHATDTQVSIAKTEQAIYDAQATNAEYQRLQSIQMTEQAYQVAQAQTAAATQTQGIQTAYAAYTFSAQTAQATQTSGQATAGAGATATQLAATQQIERDAFMAKRLGIWGVVIFVLFGIASAVFLGLAFLAVKIWNLHLDGKGRFIQDSKIEPDKDGRFPALTEDAIGKGKKLINPNLAHRAVIDPNHDDLTTEQALANTQSNRELEAVRALSASTALARQYARKTNVDPALPQSDMQITKPETPLLTSDPMLTPSWSMIEDWDGKGGIPYGASFHNRVVQLEMLNLQDVPHGGVFGKTGEGKSRYFLRPFIAGAIAAGHRVVILGKQADFWPFADHPNVTMIQVRHITEENEARKYADYLARIVQEMNRRDDYLTSHHVSTWDRAGRENTLVILDELGNALDMMPREIKNEAYRWVQGLSKEGRKAGFNIWLATQRAVGFKSIVEQLGRAVFHLADADASRHALGFDGAELLNHGQFFAKFQRVKKCAAFDPTDDELVKFLQKRPVKLHEPINWIEGEVLDTKPVPAVEKTFVPEIQTPAEPTVDDKIREILNRMIQTNTVSLRQAENEAYGSIQGGSHYNKVREIYQQMHKPTTDKGTTDATTDGKMPETGPLPA